MRSVLDTLGGVYELVRLGWVTRFRFSGAYWQWRMQTAYGKGPRPGRGRMLHDVLEYARWVRRMRRSM